ncbi:prepilin peptidase [Clostridium nigeriense]|uniref:prepilin peptidase n=1 Tax=Clostridium nigeriense TaxID=1805470 RepID=UPI003D32F7E9
MYFLVLIIGLCIGSFLNVCIYRIAKEESIIFPGSHCTSCGHELKAYELVPVLSYIFLRGRCRKCKDKISIKYPLIEILNAILYLLLFWKYGFGLNFVFYCLLFSLLMVISAIDLESKYIYSSTTLVGVLLAIIYIAIGSYLGEVNILNNLLAGLIGYGIIFLIVLLTGGMGSGDADIAGICGLFIGIKGVLVTLFVAIILGGIFASIALILKFKNRKSEIAFGPYIAIGTFICIFMGEKLLLLYMNLYA